MNSTSVISQYGTGVKTAGFSNATARSRAD